VASVAGVPTGVGTAGPQAVILNGPVTALISVGGTAVEKIASAVETVAELNCRVPMPPPVVTVAFRAPPTAKPVVLASTRTPVTKKVWTVADGVNENVSTLPLIVAVGGTTKPLTVSLVERLGHGNVLLKSAGVEVQNVPEPLAGEELVTGVAPTVAGAAVLPAEAAKRVVVGESETEMVLVALTGPEVVQATAKVPMISVVPSRRITVGWGTVTVPNVAPAALLPVHW